MGSPFDASSMAAGKAENLTVGTIPFVYPSKVCVTSGSLPGHVLQCLSFLSDAEAGSESQSNFFLASGYDESVHC